jgi:hypothetical protein
MKALIKYFLTSLLLFTALMGFKNSITKSENQILTFDLQKLPKQTTLKLSDLGATDIQYIPLETSEHSVIKDIRNISISKSYVLIRYFSDINMFRQDGSFITKIGTKGRGPNEFISAQDVDINAKNESIYLVDGLGQKFLVFSKKGNFIRTIKIPQTGAVTFKFTEDRILLYNQNHMGNIENSYNLLDTTGNIIKNFPNKYPWKRTVPTLAFLGENIFYRFNNTLLKKEVYCDTIYAYNNKGFIPHLIINVGSMRLTPTARAESTVDFINSNYLSPENLFEFGDYIYYEFLFTFNGKLDVRSFIGSKKNNFKALFNPEKDLINDLDAGPCIWPKTIWDDNTLVSWIDALKLKTWVASETFKNYNPIYPQKKTDLEILAAKLKETDNPILILIKIK